MKEFGGKVLFLDRSDINTDEIIPAKYLTEITKAALKPYCLEDLKLGSFDARTDLAGKAAIVTRANFGCGSSREHAPWALEVNGINLVVAESFARIFRGNMYNCGMLAVEVAPADLNDLFAQFAGKEASVAVDLKAATLSFTAPGVAAKTVKFKLGEFENALVQAGGWVEYAAAKY
jgi:3-isopropylmalate/(R)-2-methylmalate dehydratase small subunit